VQAPRLFHHGAPPISPTRKAQPVETNVLGLLPKLPGHRHRVRRRRRQRLLRSVRHRRRGEHHRRRGRLFRGRQWRRDGAGRLRCSRCQCVRTSRSHMFPVLISPTARASMGGKYGNRATGESREVTIAAGTLALGYLAIFYCSTTPYSAKADPGDHDRAPPLRAGRACRHPPLHTCARAPLHPRSSSALRRRRLRLRRRAPKGVQAAHAHRFLRPPPGTSLRQQHTHPRSRRRR
jgi:hypothetical protein